eukprot:1586108-Rhodomonas_salina.1
MVVLQWHSESVPGFLDVHQDQCGWRLLMIRQNVDPVTLGLVSREEADVIKHGHWFARSSLRKEFLESREGTPDGYMGAVWLDVVGSGNIDSFRSLPSVVTWNHWMRKQDGARIDGFKCSKSIFSCFPSVVTWTLHAGWKQNESNWLDGLLENAEERSGSSVKESAMAVDAWGLLAEDNGDLDGQGKKGGERDMEEDGQEDDLEIEFLGVVSGQDTDEDSTGGVVEERIEEVEQRDYSAVMEETVINYVVLPCASGAHPVGVNVLCLEEQNTTPGKICPDYLCIRARRLIHEQDGKLTVRDVKVLHLVVMITLNTRDNSEKLKRMQTDEIQRCQETLDSRAALPKRRTRRVVEGKEKCSNTGWQKQSSDINGETIGEHNKHQRRGVSHEDRQLKLIDDRTSKRLGKVVIVKQTGGKRGLGLFASVDIGAH